MIYIRELKRNLKGLLIWSIVMSGLILLMLAMYPQFAMDQQAMNDMLAAYPESLKQAFGMDTLNFGTFIGFYSVQAYMMTTLIGSVYAALLASGILVKEESEKTIEFLLSKPVTRSSIIMQKVSAVLTNLLIFNAAMIVTTVLCFGFSNGEQIDMGLFALLFVATILLHLTVASAAFLLSAVLRKNRSIMSLSLGLVFLSYALHIIAGLSGQLDSLRNFSVFSYVDAATIVANEALSGTYTVIMLAVMVLSVGGAYLYYRKKDIAG